MSGSTARHPLDDALRSSLTGAHAHLAERRGKVLRYQVDVAPFIALPEEPTAADWDDLAALAGPGRVIVLSEGPAPPDGWEVVMSIPGVQLSGEEVEGARSVEAIGLEARDVPEMLGLVERTKPGPFLPRTIELGDYLGIRRGRHLVAMAGERLHPPGWTEISAVCTDAAVRGQGLATELVLAIVAGIRDRGELPMMHAAADNTNAIRLYQSLGFRLRRTMSFAVVRVPTPAGHGP